MKEVTVIALRDMITAQKDIQLIDIREEYEREYGIIEGDIHIPMGMIPQRIADIARDKDVIIYCRSGHRSARVIQYLERTHGFDNLYNLQDGILAWADEIDATITKY